MLKNAYLLAKIGANTAESDPSFRDKHLANVGQTSQNESNGPMGEVLTEGTVDIRMGTPRSGRRKPPWQILEKLAKFCEFLAGSFSAVSKRKFSRKYAFDSIFQALQDLHTFAPLQSKRLATHRFTSYVIFVKIQQHFFKCCKICKLLPNFKNFS